MTKQRRATGEEAGFTLIELMVSLSILAIGILGAVPLFATALKTANISANRTRALALATRDIESYRAEPYCEAGYATTQTGYAASWTDPVDAKSYSTVTITNPPAAQRAPSGPDESVSGQTYHFERHIVWASATSPDGRTTYVQAYKRVTVIVTWQDRGANLHTVRQDTYLYPGGLGAYSAANCGAAGAPGAGAPPSAPTTLTATPNATKGDTEIDLSWTPPTGGGGYNNYRVVYSSDNFATTHTLSSTLTNSATSYPVTGLTPSTTYQFQIFAVQTSTGSEAASNTISATTAAPTAAYVNCTAGLVTLTPSGQDQITGGFSLGSDESVSLNTTGTCPYLQLSYQPVAGGPTTQTVAATQTSTGVWTATIPASTTNWSVGSHTVLVQNNQGTTLVQSSLLVCTAGKATCP